MRWQNGDRYEGDLKDGFRHGHGVYQCKSTGGKYTGNYENDLKSGDGTYKYSNGDSFEGQWSEGLRHGHGFINGWTKMKSIPETGKKVSNMERESSCMQMEMYLRACTTTTIEMDKENL